MGGSFSHIFWDTHVPLQFDSVLHGWESQVEMHCYTRGVFLCNKYDTHCLILDFLQSFCLILTGSDYGHSMIENISAWCCSLLTSAMALIEVSPFPTLIVPCSLCSWSRGYGQNSLPRYSINLERPTGYSLVQTVRAANRKQHCSEMSPLSDFIVMALA